MNTNKEKHNNQKFRRVVSGNTSKIGLSITRIISTKFLARQTKKRNLSITQGTPLMVADLVKDNLSVSRLLVDKSLVKKCLYEQCLKVLDPDFSIEGIDFNHPFTKKFFLAFWVKRHLTIGHGKPILTVDLYKYYQKDMQKECTPNAILDERVFFKNIVKCMTLFSIRPIKVRILGGRGYAGITYCDLTDNNDKVSKPVVDRYLYQQLLNKLDPNFLIKDINFNNFFSKEFFLSFWIKRHLMAIDNTFVPIADLYKYYQKDMQKECTPDGILDEREFFKNIDKSMAIFSIRLIKLNTTGGQAYAGITYCDITENTYENLKNNKNLN
jgi:hypothetical protein